MAGVIRLLQIRFTLFALFVEKEYKLRERYTDHDINKLKLPAITYLGRK